jgi:mTERF domain-containing protein, mitochondrial
LVTEARVQVYHLLDLVGNGIHPLISFAVFQLSCTAQPVVSHTKSQPKICLKTLQSSASVSAFTLLRQCSMTMNLFLGRIHSLHPYLPPKLNSTPALASSNGPTQASPPNAHFVLDYLVQSCGLSSDQARSASNLIPHLKSPDKPDAVLQFLREIGVSESDIRKAVSRDARILCSSVENIWRPNITKLREVGYSIEDISGIICRRPSLFRYRFGAKLDFWMQTVGTVEFALKSETSLLCSSLKNVLIPNLSFLKEQCGSSPRQILRLIKSNPRLVSCRPDVLQRQTQRAEELGVARTSGAFIYALIVVSYLNQATIDARLNNLKSLGFSQEEVTTIVSKLPLVLSQSEEMMSRRIEFLINVIGCDKFYLVQNPSLLTYSLDMRLIPRNVVRKLLKSKRIPAADRNLASFMKPTEKQFLARFVLPFEHAIPGLHQAYADASASKTAAQE